MKFIKIYETEKCLIGGSLKNKKIEVDSFCSNQTFNYPKILRGYADFYT